MRKESFITKYGTSPWPLVASYQKGEITYLMSPSLTKGQRSKIQQSLTSYTIEIWTCEQVSTFNWKNVKSYRWITYEFPQNIQQRFSSNKGQRSEEQLVLMQLLVCCFFGSEENFEVFDVSKDFRVLLTGMYTSKKFVLNITY